MSAAGRISRPADKRAPNDFDSSSRFLIDFESRVGDKIGRETLLDGGTCREPPILASVGAAETAPRPPVEQVPPRLPYGVCPPIAMFGWTSRWAIVGAAICSDPHSIIPLAAQDLTTSFQGLPSNSDSEVGSPPVRQEKVLRNRGREVLVGKGSSVENIRPSPARCPGPTMRPRAPPLVRERFPTPERTVPLLSKRLPTRQSGQCPPHHDPGRRPPRQTLAPRTCEAPERTC
jgi:hypothetical protein